MEKMISDKTFSAERALYHSEGLTLINCRFEGIEDGESALKESKDIIAKNCYMDSFQYVKNLVIEDSELDTKDAFWHAENVTVRNSVVKGEYLGWYSDGLTLINCRIIGTQPLCYCKNLKFVDCTTENADLAFEYSDVEAVIKGGIISVKNPRSGRIVSDGIGEAILTPDSVYPPNAEIVIRGK